MANTAAKVIGKTELQKYRKGKPLTSRQAIVARCCACMDEYADHTVDCLNTDCPLHPFMPYKDEGIDDTTGRELLGAHSDGIEGADSLTEPEGDTDAASDLNHCSDKAGTAGNVEGVTMTLYCDGSANGSTIHEWCVVTADGPIVGTMEGDYSNNEMEWYAMLEALRMASPGDTICSDSKLVVNQLRGKWRVKDEKLMPLAKEGWNLRKQKKVRIWWVPRGRNLAGLHLEGKF